MGWVESLSYESLMGADISPGGSGALRASHEEVILLPHLRAALRSINGQLGAEVVEEVVRIVSRPTEASLESSNRSFHKMLTEGIDVEYRSESGETRGRKIWLIDYDHPARNRFSIASAVHR